MDPAEEFLGYIVGKLVSNPDNIRIERTTDERGDLLTLSVSKADMGKVIGREGQTAKAIRTLLHSLNSNNGIPVALKIVDPKFETGSARSAFEEAGVAR